jgi:hypothetical protein
MENLGKACLFLGVKTPIQLSDIRKPKTECVLENGTLVLYLDDKLTTTYSDDLLNTALHSFLFKQSKRFIEKRVTQYLTHFKVKPRKITIEKSIKKWGTCNAQRELTFNYMLITKPTEVIDYVVVHELCHMTHLNHDRSFWRLLGSILPNYKTLEKKLDA